VTAGARILALETRSEFLKLVRLPMFAVPVLAMPVMFYALFGLALGGSRSVRGVDAATYMVATYGVFGVVAAALSALGIGIAMERGQGWLLVKRASPMPPAAYFAAKVAMSMLFAGVIALLLFAVAATLGGVRLPLATWGALAGTLVVGAVPFCALGCAIGALAGPNSAPAIVNLLHLPMSFASGLWIPFEYLPPAVRAISPLLPPYHFARLALRAVGADSSPAAPHLLALGAFSALCLAIAVVAFRRDDGRTYG
jgi:ABC-2 type transport system permease protein